MNKSIILLPVLTLSLIFLVPLAKAAVVTTVDPSAPTSGVLIQSGTAGTIGGSGWRNDQSSHTDVGESFLVPLTYTSFTLDKITVQLNDNTRSGAPNAAFGISIYQVSGSATAPSGTPFSSQTGTITGLTSGANINQYLTFDLSDVSLTPGDYYVFMFDFTTQATNRSLLLTNSSGNPYANGLLWTFNAATSTYTPSTGVDLNFYVQGTAVPEPKPTALLLLGMTAFGAVILKRRTRRS